MLLAKTGSSSYNTTTIAGDGMLCRLHAAAAGDHAAAIAGDAVVAGDDRPDLDNNDKSRPARKSSHHQLKKCFDTKNYYYLLLTELCVYCLKFSQNKTKKLKKKKNLAPILVS